MKPAVSVNDVTKRYGEVEALKKCYLFCKSRRIIRYYRPGRSR